MNPLNRFIFRKQWAQWSNYTNKSLNKPLINPIYPWKYFVSLTILEVERLVITFVRTLSVVYMLAILLLLKFGHKSSFR